MFFLCLYTVLSMGDRSVFCVKGFRKIQFLITVLITRRCLFVYNVVYFLTAFRMNVLRETKVFFTGFEDIVLTFHFHSVTGLI